MAFKEPNGRGYRLDKLWERRDQIPQQAWIVPDLIPVGFSILAGREKSGKSLMMFASIAIAVALGAAVFGLYPTTPGAVLYLALEEGLTTIASRMERVFSRIDDEWHPPPNFYLYLGDEIDSFTDRGLSQLEELIKLTPGVKLVVIDTLRLLVPPKRNSAYSTDYDHEYEVGSLLQKLALKYNIAIVALHHTTKAPHADLFDSIGGTAWTKAAEMLAVLERIGVGAKLHVRGRSLPTSVSQLTQDPETLLWTKVNDGNGNFPVPAKQSQSEIDRVGVEQVFGDAQRLRYTDVSQRFASLKLSESSARRWLKSKTEEGLIRRCQDASGYELVQPETNCHHQPALWDDAEGGTTSESLPPSVNSIGNGDGGSDDEWDNEIEVTPESTEII